MFLICAVTFKFNSRTKAGCNTAHGRESFDILKTTEQRRITKFFILFRKYLCHARPKIVNSKKHIRKVWLKEDCRHNARCPIHTGRGFINSQHIHCNHNILNGAVRQMIKLRQKQFIRPSDIFLKFLKISGIIQNIGNFFNIF